jgi:predicted nucleotidyltransferase component of viral defense system
VSINTELILIEAIAAELVVDASLVEKDWYAIRIIAAIAKVQHSTMRLVFSGGTSLAKV